MPTSVSVAASISTSTDDTEDPILGQLKALGTVEAMYLADFGVTLETGVSAWADQSSKARDLTQAVAAAQPELVTGALNGHPVIRFDGTDDYLDGAWAWGQPLYKFIVCKPSRSNTISVPIMDGAEAWYLIDVHSVATGVRHFGGNDSIVATHATKTASDWTIIRTVSDGASSSIQLDAGTPATGNATLTGAGLTLGASNAQASYGDCDIAALIEYSSIADSGAIYNLLKARYVL